MVQGKREPWDERERAAGLADGAWSWVPRAGEHEWSGLDAILGLAAGDDVWDGADAAWKDEWGAVFGPGGGGAVGTGKLRVVS